MADLNQVKIDFESLMRLCLRTRKQFTAIPDFKRMRTLVIEFVGMGGTGKSRLIAELSSKFLNSYSIVPLVYNEPDKQVAHVSKNKDPKVYRQAQYKRTCENLIEVIDSEREIAFFDRGIFDFILWFNQDFVDKILTEDECRKGVQDAVNVGNGKVDLVFVMIDDIEQSLKGKTALKSVSLMDSLGLRARSFDETIARHLLHKRMYEEFFIGKDSERVRSAVKHLIDMDLQKTNRDFTVIFEQTAVIIALYLVFKTWESLFLDCFAKKLEASNVGIKEEIKKLAGLLDNFFAQLRDLMKGQNFNTDIRKILESYSKTRFEIARYKNVRVIVEGIFDSPPKYEVIGI